MKSREFLIFFTENNSSGYKTKEKILRNRYPELYNDIINHSKKIENRFNLSFKEKIWYFINDVVINPKCPVCGENINFGRSITEGYNKYCSIKCTNADKGHIDKVKKTNNIIYGGNAPACSSDIRDKMEKTNFDTYGVKNSMQIPYVKEIFKKKTNEKYNVDYYFQSNKHRNRSVVKYKENGLVGSKNGVYTIYCDECKKNYDIDINLFFYRKRNDINLCPICSPIKSFVKQRDVFSYVKSLIPDVDVKKNTRTIIKPKEIDIYVPTLRTGFEFNGLYWHSSLFKSPTDHQEKQEKAEINEIKLFQIFEDEWDNKKEIIKSMIRNSLKLLSLKIYARKCEIRTVDTITSKEFMNNNHLQGYTNSKIKLGLYYNNELVSMMMFNKPRIIIGGNKTPSDDIFEITRFASQLNTSVVGGASKLLSYFVKNHSPKKIISYADRRFSTGNLYKQLGFDFIRYTKPNYYYLLKNKRLHRFNLNKQTLIKLGYDKNKTEKQITEENNIYRIYDCGSLLFEKYF